MAKKTQQNARRTPKATLKALHITPTLTPDELVDLIDPFESVEVATLPKPSPEYNPMDFEDRLLDLGRVVSRADRAL
jgi:hypothetical protein